MWIIRHVDTDECYYLLPSNEKYSVGRASSKDFDVVLRGDTSISRTHAFLYLQKSGTECVLQLEDASSKFGTFHNDLQVTAGIKIPVHAGDRIRFGLLKNVWSVSHYPLVCMTSALPSDQLQQLQHYLSTVGGTLLPQWEDTCTHLTMCEVTVTVKVLHALLEQLPIVTCEYWCELSHAVRRRTSTLPVTAAYTPRCCESIINSDAVDLQPCAVRKTLFVGIIFVFMNRKHYDMYAGIVQKAGAKCRDLNSRGGVSKSFLVKSQVVVIQYVPSTQSQSTQTINSIEEYLETHDLRVIPEYEIGLAILHCSTTKYCNPSYKVLNDLIPSTMHAGMDEAGDTVLVKNTHLTNSLADSQVSDVLIPETQVNPNVPSRSQMQMEMLDDADDVQMVKAAKSAEIQSMTQMRVSESVKEQSQNAKRKHSTENDANMKDEQEKNVSSSAKRSDLDAPITKRIRTHKKVAEVVKRSASPPTTSAKQPKTRHTINSSGFISKPTATQEEEELANIDERQNNATTHKKRPHIALITEDDDDDDLFNFGNDKSTDRVAKKSRRSGSNAKNDDELFSFGVTQNSVDSTSADEDDDDDNLGSTQRFDSNKEMDKPYQLPKPKQLPKKVSAEGWLSCALGKVKIEKADNEENMSQNGIKDDDESINLPENCVQVHMFSVRGKPDTQREDSTLTHSASASTSDKRNNFKRFVKRYHRPCANVNC